MNAENENLPARREETEDLLAAIAPPKPLSLDTVVLQTLRFNASASGGFYRLSGGVESDPITNLEVVILANKGMRVMMPPMEDGQSMAGAKPRCKSIDGVVSSYGEFEGRKCEACDKSQWGKGGQKPECTEEMAFLVWLIEYDMPVVVTFKTKGLSEAKSFLQSLSITVSEVMLPNGTTQKLRGNNYYYIYPVVLGAKEAISGGRQVHIPTFSIQKEKPYSYEDLQRWANYSNGLSAAFEAYGQMRRVDDDDDYAVDGEVVEDDGGIVSEVGMDAEPMDSVLMPQQAAQETAAPAVEEPAASEEEPTTKRKPGRPRKAPNW